MLATIALGQSRRQDFVEEGALSIGWSTHLINLIFVVYEEKEQQQLTFCQKRFQVSPAHHNK